ncbi:MAG TPA: ATP-binding cassette domain-containing protein [Actinomycetota bacterium]|nr:ATP-binding cassette domain-containing protein [Actinomycetota bacterium]
MTDAVVFDNVTFQYMERAEYALREVTLSIPEGAFTLVCGATGAGKSTLLRAINGLVPHFPGGGFSGHVRVEGRDTLEFPPRKLADVVAFVPQDPGASFVVDRVEDELAYAMENLAIDPARMRRRVEETLDLLDIERLRTRSVRTLSGGERQRVAIASALTPGAKVLLLDEPTSQLDPQAAEDVLAALQRLVHDLGLTVVIAEHRLDRVAGFVDLAIGCHGKGRVEIGDPAAVLERLQTGPPVSRLGRMLGWRPVPLTVRDARRMAAGRRAAPARSPRPRVQLGEVLLEARDLTASYDGTTVLRDVTLSLRAGEIVALMGRNGAGKTTLLRCLAGVQHSDAGAVVVEGGSPRTGIDVALCPQTPEDVLFSDTVADEVRATLKAHGRLDDGSVESVLDGLGIGHLAERHPRDLSAGERLLAAVAAVVTTDARVLLLDEPTRGLDAETKERLSKFLRAHAAGGRAVVFASHDVELVAELANRVVMLAGGEQIADGTPRAVLAESPVFAPQTAKVLGGDFMTPDDVGTSVPG